MVSDWRQSKIFIFSKAVRSSEGLFLWNQFQLYTVPNSRLHYEHAQSSRCKNSSGLCPSCFILLCPLTCYLQGCIQKFPDWVNNEINNKHLLRSNMKGYGGKTTRLTHKIAVQLHLVAESFWIHPHMCSIHCKVNEPEYVLSPPMKKISYL
jgi:hypothetical protein